MRVLQPVNSMDMRPGTLYRAVCLRPHQQNKYGTVQFIESMSQGPILEEQVNRLKASGPLCNYYEYHADMQVTWPDGADNRHVVYVPSEEKACSSKPKRRRRKRKDSE